MVLHEPVARRTSPRRSGTRRSPRSTRCSSTCCIASSASTSRVVLSGLGGDELFAGYDIYGYLRAQPAAPVRVRSARRCARSRRPLDWIGAARRRARSARNSISRPASSSGSPRPDGSGPPLPAVAQRLGLQPRAAAPGVHAGVRSTGSRHVDPRRVRPATSTATADSRPQALRAEFATKMVCDLLHNEDTMSMAHSVESRVPLLDLELVRFAARIPDRRALRRRHEGPAQGRLARRAARPGPRQEEMGLHLRSGRAVREGSRPDGP